MGFPPNLDTEALYPEKFVKYTSAMQEAMVPCFVPGEVNEMQADSCPVPFVTPGTKHASSPCPGPGCFPFSFSVPFPLLFLLGSWRSE